MSIQKKTNMNQTKMQKGNLLNWVKMRKMKKTRNPNFENELEKARLYLELSISSDKTIRDASERLSQKIKGIFTTAATLIPMVAGLGYFILKEGYNQWIFWFILSSLLFLFIAIGLGFWLHKPGDFKYLDASIIFKKYKRKSLKFLINKSASTLADITIHNSSVLNSKENWVKWMIIFILISLFCVALAFITFVMSILN